MPFMDFMYLCGCFALCSVVMCKIERRERRERTRKEKNQKKRDRESKRETERPIYTIIYHYTVPKYHINHT